MSELIDNRAQRISTLKDIIQHLHKGEAPELVRDRLVQIVKQTDATEIMCMEQELIDGGMKVEEVRSMCDLHSQVTRGMMVNQPTRILAAGHPVDTFKRENAALGEVTTTLRTSFSEICGMPDPADATAVLFRARQASNDLMDIDKHYQRKEHALFSCLERHGITGPSKVMWAKDDEVRDILKRLNKALHDSGTTAGEIKRLNTLALAACAAVEEMIYKEENILLPMSLQTFTENEWAEIWAASPKYGWCLVEPQQGYQPPEEFEAPETALPGDGTIMMPTGRMSVEQLTAVLSTLPLDITFVDADDRVAFFSEGPDRIFARSKAIIGRQVQHCHPPRSVETVDRILNDFRAGRQNVAEFWIDFQGKFVHIRYFAVRNQAGEYLGTLELTQDLAPLKKLEGERRLLQYETTATA